MKKSIHFSLIAIVLPILASADTYIVPAEFDNIREAQKSTGYDVIYNTTATFSANNYVLGGQSLKYRCLVIPKIVCRAASPALIPSIAETSLRLSAAKNVVPVYTANFRIEDDGGANWHLCAAAYGGITADKSELTSSIDGLGNTVINYVYEPNHPSQSILAYFCTDNANRGDDSSYIAMRWKQVCR